MTAYTKRQLLCAALCWVLTVLPWCICAGFVLAVAGWSHGLILAGAAADKLQSTSSGRGRPAAMLGGALQVSHEHALLGAQQYTPLDEMF
jgi:hypothetical protein